MSKQKRLKILRYFGAKTYLLDDIFEKASELYPDRMTAFVDVFGGSGTVVLNVPPEWKVNKVYNDIDLRLYNLFKVLKDDEKRKRLFEMLDWSLPHRKIFDELKQQTEFKDDVEMAYNYLYIHFNSFNEDERSFRVNINNLSTEYESQVNLLKNNFFAIKYLTIECLNYKELIKKYDSPTTFFYLDPPYLKSGVNYKFSFTIKDFQEMHNILMNIKGYWLMNESEVDFPEIIKIFGEPQMVKEYLNYANSSRIKVNSQGKRSYRKEGFWYNF